MLILCPNLLHLSLCCLSELKEETTFEPYLKELISLQSIMSSTEVQYQINISLFTNLLSFRIFIQGNPLTVELFTPVIKSNTLHKIEINAMSIRQLSNIIAPNLITLNLIGLSIGSFKDKIGTLDKLQSLVLNSCSQFDSLDGIASKNSLNYFKMVNCNLLTSFNLQSYACIRIIEIMSCTRLTSCIFLVIGLKNCIYQVCL